MTFIHTPSLSMLKAFLLAKGVILPEEPVEKEVAGMLL